MGLKVTSFFDEPDYNSTNQKVITCKNCLNHLCLSTLVISSDFSGASGKAFLVDSVLNYEFYGIPVKLEMLTGIYLISKVRCIQCKTGLGWYYNRSFTSTECYKEGKFVIELAYLNFVESNTNKKLIDRVKKKRQNSNESNSSTESNLSLLSSSSISSSKSELVHKWKNKYYDKNLYYGEGLDMLLNENDENERE